VYTSTAITEVMKTYRRVITGVAWTPASGGATATITLDGDPFLANETSVYGYFPAQTKEPTYTVNTAELVLWKIDYSGNKKYQEYKNQPIAYNKLVLEANNRLEASSFEKVYQLPDNTRKIEIFNQSNVVQPFVRLVSPLTQTLMSTDLHLNSYRLSLDNIPTTDTDIVKESSLHKDRIFRTLGQDLRTFDAMTVDDVFYAGELVLTDNPRPLLDVRETANDGETLHASVMYVYSHQETIVKL
jgi:hypothetical protein